jgi:hypothetical protein
MRDVGWHFVYERPISSFADLVPQNFNCSYTQPELEEDLAPIFKIFYPRCALEVFWYDDRVARHDARAAE